MNIKDIKMNSILETTEDDLICVTFVGDEFINAHNYTNQLELRYSPEQVSPATRFMDSAKVNDDLVSFKKMLKVLTKEELLLRQELLKWQTEGRPPTKRKYYITYCTKRARYHAVKEELQSREDPYAFFSLMTNLELRRELSRCRQALSEIPNNTQLYNAAIGQYKDKIAKATKILTEKGVL